MTYIHRLADVGVLAEVADLDAVLHLDAAVRRARDADEGAFAEVIDVVPAARTLLLTTPPGADLDRLARAVRALDVHPDDAAADEDVVDIEVTYDGPDLDDIASLTGLTPEEVVTAHGAKPWRAAFGGFAPGFFYLVPTGEEGRRLQVPRRDEPRTRVPAGAVGLAGEFSGIYPRSSPGGWQLLGRTTAALWDIDREPPALLRPGALVRFVAVGAS